MPFCRKQFVGSHTTERGPSLVEILPGIAITLMECPFFSSHSTRSNRIDCRGLPDLRFTAYGPHPQSGEQAALPSP